MPHRNKQPLIVYTMSRTARATAARLCAQTLPSAAAAATTALLAPFGVWVAAALAGAGAWAGMERRRSKLVVAPQRFIGS